MKNVVVCSEIASRYDFIELVKSDVEVLRKP